mgnify:CR=1 FL=1
MARNLKFALGGQPFTCELHKVDRDKLYGWVDTVAVDKDGKECHIGSISTDGMHLFSRGSFELGYLDVGGHWLERDALSVVDADNQLLEKRESSFNAEIALVDTVPIDTYLAHAIKSVYQLEADPALLEQVKACAEIYCFEFNYYASYDPNTAFLIESDGNLFMTIGQHCGFDYVQLHNIESTLLEDDEEEEESDDDDIDFSMF